MATVAPQGERDDIDESQAQELTIDGPQPGTEDEMRTVFNDPTAFNVKHPLYSSWTLWFDSPSTKGRAGGTGTPSTPSTAVPATPSGSQGWMDDIKKVVSFESVEEFWGLFNNIVPPSSLPQRANYYLFKENIIPAWEDAANKDGGKWSIQLPKEKNRNNVDKMWLYTMLAAIGETFDPYLTKANTDGDEPPPSSLITGVIVSTRPQFYRLSIWTRQAPANTNTPEDEQLRARVEAIGKYFKTQVLGYGDTQKLGGPLATDVEFVSHKDSEKKGKGTKKITV
ncbi:eukaryotic translation initiation factor 4E [Serendipita sp. 396]|nr:eukaryotic translation initiation factor 4E [Serendipita sp. 396]KAG8785083.1 eukaryotic translation initiation factor 4E [Serendipita sp. 397]KAG8800807.1 eukaryotic translation initiation factor 4E [Serendipita sp. 398]KAG8807346.1 eukaryotic translation initiation factor 4E [Serendipita sp. 401]KAG8834995.1 eukaryotic translation initiation factor 4E [Serendipita sp. 400]KAG8859951.1 eukaryotic translation initiation factor 4E [Serendipita sp. 411]KAG8869846.1 eukaryotic translation ini